MAKLMAYGQVGLEMAAPIGLGWLLDGYLGTQPWLIVAGAILGLVAGLTHLVLMMNKEEQQRRSGK
jgi:F0F1-type ATP synthase assembly protein I